VDIAFHSKKPQQIAATIRYCADIAHLNQLRTPSLSHPRTAFPRPHASKYFSQEVASWLNNCTIFCVY
ncbi:MAG: hypothetical protein WA886_09395, partial [Candidatus Acidiferrales bacterium]